MSNAENTCHVNDIWALGKSMMHVRNKRIPILKTKNGLR